MGVSRRSTGHDGEGILHGLRTSVTGPDPGEPGTGPSTALRRLPIRAVLDRGDRPRVAALVALLVGVLFVALRLAVAGDGDAARLVLASQEHVVDRSLLPSGFPVTPGPGYDGQFYYRLATEPWDLSVRDADDAIALDVANRRTRIGYPVLAWIAAGGQAAAVPAALLAVNVAALALGAGAGAVLAQAAGRHALWGLLPVGYPGIVVSLARDLTEVTALALLVGGLAALARSRPVLAAAAFTAGSLCRETALLAPLALFLVRTPALVWRRGRPERIDLAWALPAAVWAGWQGVTAGLYGELPITSAAGNSGGSGTAAVGAVLRWLEDAPSRLPLLAVLAALLLLAVLALTAVRRSAGAATAFVGLALATLLVLSLSDVVWGDDLAQFRTFAEVHAFAGAALLAVGGRLRLLVAAAATSAVWLAVASLYVRAL